MIYVPGLFIALSALWLALSGHGEAFMLGLAVVSVLLSVAITMRLGLMGREASPYHRLVPMAGYSVWLMGEIVKSNVAVLHTIIEPSARLRPRLVSLDADGRSELAAALFANSITLTPGTVTIEAARDGFLVHSLHDGADEQEEFAPMAARSLMAADRRG